MIVTLSRRCDQTLVFSDAAQVAGIQLHGSHSKLYAFSCRLNERGIRNGWTATVRAAIIGSPKATPQERDLARQIVWRCHFYHYEMLVGDRRGIDETVVAACNRLNTRYRTFGTTVRPLNGGKHYTCIVVQPGCPLSHRDAVRMNWIAEEADILYLIGDALHLNETLLRGKDVIRVASYDESKIP